MSKNRSIPFLTDAVIVYVLRKKADKIEILLLKRNDGTAIDRYWLHVAGGIEHGEKAWQTAVRELREETGLTPECLYSANYCEQFYSVGRDAIAVLPLFVAFVLPDAEVRINEEHTAFQWFSVEEAQKVAPFENQRQNLRVVNESFIQREPAEFLRIKLSE